MIRDLFRTIRGHANRQDGVAILLTVMIVSGIAVISVTVAFFVMQEVRNARSSALTEPAIIAAESAGEQGIYQAKRGTFTANCATAPYTHLDGTTTGGNTDTRIKKCVSTQDVVVQISAATPFVFTLYDYNNVNGNTCMEDDLYCPTDGGGFGNQLYTAVSVTHMSGTANLSVDIDTVDGIDYRTGTVTPGNTGTYNIDRDIINSNDERLRVTLTPTSGTVTVRIFTAGLAGYAPGLPDYQTIDAEACRGTSNITGCDTTQEAYRRRINITLPR